MTNCFRCLLLTVLAAFAAPSPVAAAGTRITDRELLVVPAEGAAPAAAATAIERAGLLATEIGESGVLRVRVSADEQASTEVRLASLPSVADVETNSIVRAAATNDPYASQQWALSNAGGSYNGVAATRGADLEVEDAWRHSTGAGGIVAVADSGADLAHPDLRDQLWQNPADPRNGRDDDSDGLVDDHHGWDFISGDSTPDDRNGHGTHVAGIIGARRDNGVGVAGVAPDSKLMILRVLDDAGRGNLDDVVKAIDYAGRHNASVLNLSLTASSGEALAYAARQHPRMLIVAAAGNESLDLGRSPRYPCQTAAANVICVGASDPQDQPASFSNFSATEVDLFAPGRAVIGLGPVAAGSSPVWMSGTSMAAPHVAGVAALVHSARPAAPGAWVKRRLMQAAARVPSMTDKSASGRVAAAAALTDLPAAPPTPGAPAVSVDQADEFTAATLHLTSGGNHECSVDGAPWLDCPAVFRPTVAVGTHSVRVRQRDEWDNFGVEAVAAWTVRERPRELAPLRFAQTPPASTTSTTAYFRFAAEPTDAMQCRLDGGDWVMCSGGERSLAGLAAGRHVLTVALIRPGSTQQSIEWAWVVETAAATPRPPAPREEAPRPTRPVITSPRPGTKQVRSPQPRVTPRPQAKRSGAPIRRSSPARGGTAPAKSAPRGRTPSRKPAIKRLRARRVRTQAVVSLSLVTANEATVRFAVRTTRCSRNGGRGCVSLVRALGSRRLASGDHLIRLSLRAERVAGRIVVRVASGGQRTVRSVALS